jgi:hypothetical protein
MAEATRRMRRRDPDDADVLALALHLDVPIWSNDIDFEEAGIQWHTTAELLNALGFPPAPAREAVAAAPSHSVVGSHWSRVPCAMESGRCSSILAGSIAPHRGAIRQVSVILEPSTILLATTGIVCVLRPQQRQGRLWMACVRLALAAWCEVPGEFKLPPRFDKGFSLPCLRRGHNSGHSRLENGLRVKSSIRVSA